jgi:hypothetical protein
MIAKKACPVPDTGGHRFSRRREALAPLITWLGASAGEGRSEKIMREQ